MPILNYTTTIEVQKTVGEISAMLGRAKATAILTELEEGIVSAISFRIKTEFGVLTFRLPANTQRIYQVIARDRLITPRMRTKEQAAPGSLAYRQRLAAGAACDDRSRSSGPRAGISALRSECSRPDRLRCHEVTEVLELAPGGIEAEARMLRLRISRASG